MLSNTCETIYLCWQRNTIYSTEGTTHNKTVGMGMYATRMFPLLQLNESSNKMNDKTKRLAFAHDFIGAGKLQWDSIVSHGPNIGYYPKASVSWLTIKDQHFNDAIKIFESNGKQITVKKGTQQLVAIIRRIQTTVCFGNCTKLDTQN